MRFFICAIGIGTLALLAGCSTKDTSWGNRATAPVGGICDAQLAQGMVGQSSTARVVEEARIQSGAHLARVLRPGQIMTKEYDVQRLNLEVDGSGRVIAVRCG